MLSRSIADFDRPQSLVVNYVYPLPSFRSGWVRHVVGVRQASGTTPLGKGLPMVLTVSDNTRLPGVSATALRLKDWVPDSSQRALERHFDTSAFAPAPTCSLGSDSRTQPRLRTPGIKTCNIMLARNRVFRERVNLQFRAEFFNAFNTPQFHAPNRSVTSISFGQITSASGARQIQLALRLSF